MLEGVPGTAHTLPLLIFHVILHKKVQIHLTAWELFVHVEMALQPGSLFKLSLFFNSKVLFTGVENSTLHNLCAQPADYWWSNLSPAALCQSRWAADFGRGVLAHCGMLSDYSGSFFFRLCETQQRGIVSATWQHHALADHSFRFPEKDFSDHM